MNGMIEACLYNLVEQNAINNILRATGTLSRNGSHHEVALT
jgi:hypothetical protein